MSILENFVQLVLKFKGSRDDALMEVQSFVAQLFCSLFHIGKNQELLIFNQCLKKMDLVLMNLHNYFKGAPLPIEKMFNDKPFLQEGFVSSEDEVEKAPKKTTKRSETFNVKEPTLAVDEKVKLRDEVIQKMTIGYLKDVQHLREMFVRKDLFPNEEIFDVSYYDYTNNLDPIIKSFIYNKILDVTQQFRLQIQKLSLQNQKLLNEIEKLRQLVKKIVGSAEIESQIRAILSIDKDIYRFWRGVQDVIGTQQIFEIFEKRKMGYGIDYTVIDQCISNSQASGRIYAEYKQQLEDQQIKFTEQVGREIVQLRKQIESLSYQMLDHEEEQKTDFLQVKGQIRTGVESIYEIKQNTIRDQYRENLQEALDLISDKDTQLWIRRAIKGHALYKWIYWAKIKSLIKPHNMRRAQSRDKDYKSINLFGLKDNRVQMLKQELKEKHNELLETQMNFYELKGEHSLLKSKFTNIKYNFEMQIQRSVYMQQNLVQLENIVEYFSRIFKFIKSKLGFGYLEINLKNSQYCLDRADLHIKQFEMRVQKLKLEDHDLLTELVEQQAKRQIMYRKMNQNNAVDSSIITDVYDVTKPLQDPENDLNQYQLLMIDQLKQTEIDNQQAELEMQQAEEKYYLEQIKLQEEYTDDEEQFEKEEFLLKSNQSPTHQMKQSLVIRKNSINKPEPKEMIMTQSIKQQLAKTETNEKNEKQKSIQQIKRKNQSQQTSVSIDCTKCLNNLLERMNPEFQSPFEYPEKKQAVQISKSKLFQAKQHTIGTLLTQYNVSRMQSARGRRVYEKSMLNQTMYTSASRQESNKDRCLTFKGERAQIIITPKSLPISNRHQKHNK